MVQRSVSRQKKNEVLCSGLNEIKCDGRVYTRSPLFSCSVVILSDILNNSNEEFHGRRQLGEIKCQFFGIREHVDATHGEQSKQRKHIRTG